MKYLILFFLISFSIYAQTPPSDFKLEVSTGGMELWEISETITIEANGQGNFYRSKGGNSQEVLLDTNFTITTEQVQQIWQSVQNENFFNLNSNYENDTVVGGSYAIFTITADGVTKQVTVKNISQQQIQNIISSINSNVPSDYNIDYTPPEKINIIPQDPCNSPFGSSFSIDKKEISEAKLNKLLAKYNTTNSVRDVVQIPHAGVEIGYEESLYDAVGNGTAALSSKGDFYGDDVSITGKYPNNLTPADKKIHIKLNLEFYGPCDNSANENKIVKDIYNKWNGLATSSGQKIIVDIPHLSHPGASSPPGTPGFDEIKLACGSGQKAISYTDGLGKPNDGVASGTWYPADQGGPGTYGHEAGHLMGLDDQYSSYQKQPDGSWLNEQDKTTTYSANDYLNLYHSKYPDHSLSQDKSWLAKNKRTGWPTGKGVMGDSQAPPTQLDIDSLAEKAGLIINIKPGDMLVDKNNYQQNLVVNHSGDLFLKPGETKTLNGIYAACIDHFKEIPDTGRVFAVAPSLEKWNGINAAPTLLKLVRYIDSVGYFCNIFDDYSSQEAIWRITDNTEPLFDSTSDSLLLYIGINPNQFFDFPKMNYNLNDTISSSQYIPDQLFAADIEPKYATSNINDNTEFTAAVSSPSVGEFSTNIKWELKSPGSAAGQLNVNGSKATVTPLQGGLYSLNLDLTVTDSSGAKREFKPSQTSHIIVPDKFTETFEHSNLIDLFPWKTYGDAPWTITNAEAQTGNYSIQPGNIRANQSSTLEISLDLPSDTSFEFAVKALSSFFNYLSFYIDTTLSGIYAYNDWNFYSYNLKAGKHVLKWTYQSLVSTVNQSPGIWLDNIFFPENSVNLTSVKTDESKPLTFNLFQNYPNPFNPNTLIKYSLASESQVKLTIYDITGRKVKDLFIGEQPAGIHEVKFDGSSLSSGVYFYTIEANSKNGIFKATKKMILIK